MRIVVLSSRFPYPLEKGDKLRLFHQLKGMSQCHEIILIALTEVEVATHHLEVINHIVDEVHIVPIAKTTRHLAVIKALATGLPLSIAHYYSSTAARKIEAIIHDVKPDHIFCQLTRMSEYVRQITKINKTIDYMDAFAISMNKRSEISHLTVRWIYKMEAKRLKRYEYEVYKAFDHHIIISEKDRNMLYLPPASVVHVVPNGVDTDYFKPVNSLKDKKYEIGFIGNMGYLPNVQAAEFLVNDILPHLSKDIKVLIGGARPDKRVKQLETERVTITGWIEDIREAYASSRIIVAPIWSGTGQQNKILESMAMGIPCVTTPTVNDAIGATHKQHLILASDAISFTRAIMELLDNAQTYQRISKEGLTFVRQRYSWDESNEKLIKIFGLKPNKTSCSE